MKRAKDVDPDKIGVDEYIASAPQEVQEKLERIRSIIKEVAPDAQEKISYGMPYYGYKGRLAYFSYFKNHIGLYIMPKVLKDFEEEIKEYRTGRATLRMELNKKLPIPLIKKLIKAGVKKNEEAKK